MSKQPKKLCDRKIDFRLAAPLYEVLEREAVARSMPNMSALVRAILIEHASEQMAAVSESVAA
jgi:hypothetical protein